MSDAIFIFFDSVSFTACMASLSSACLPVIEISICIYGSATSPAEENRESGINENPTCPLSPGEISAKLESEFLSQIIVSSAEL